MKNKEISYKKIYTAIESGDSESFRQLFFPLHPRDQIHVLQELYPDKQPKLMKLLSAEEFARLFNYMEEEDRQDLPSYLTDSYLIDVLKYADNDNVVDFLQDQADEREQHYLEMMALKDRQVIEKSLQYEQDTAGAKMTDNFIRLSIDDQAGTVIDRLRQIGQQAELIYYLYVVDHEDHLVGVLSLRDLILASPTARVEDIMSPHVIAVHVKDDQEEVAECIMDYNLLAVPVLTMDGVLVGIVTVDDMVDVMEEEATEDIHKMAGISDSSNESEPTDSVWQMTKQRLPWIIILIFLGLISAQLIGFFEETLSQIVLLAAFMPTIMDTAGNVGTQSLAVSVRRLTTKDQKVPVLKQLGKEWATGIIMGIGSALVIAFLALFLYQDKILALVVSSSLLITVSLSTVVGYIVPLIFDRLNIDPAVASGPFITTINDTVGLLTYFSIATALISHF